MYGRANPYSLGSHKARARARKILRVVGSSPKGWRVQGGEIDHFVTVIHFFDKPNKYECDCRQNTEKGCSHVCAVALMLEPDRVNIPDTKPRPNSYRQRRLRKIREKLANGK